MSGGRAMPHADALHVAALLVERLRPVCERVEIAGSLRRGKPTVHDIEIVAVPRWFERPADDIWASPVQVDLLEERLAEFIAREAIRLRDVETRRRDGTVEWQKKNGSAYKALELGGMPVDLFVVRPPATWGVIFGLRTGPGDWNTRLVTECKAIGRRVEGGQVVAWRSASNSWEAVPTDTEEQFFAALGQPWVEPAERSVERIAIQRAVATEARA